MFELCGADSSLELSETFCAQQVLVKIVYDSDHAKYSPRLHKCIHDWGHQFLKLAIRVVYKLDRDNLGKEVSSNFYEGFKLFSLFGEKYPTILERFLELKNHALLALFKAQ